MTQPTTSPSPWTLQISKTEIHVIDAEGKNVCEVTLKRNGWNGLPLSAAVDLIEALIDLLGEGEGDAKAEGRA